VSYKAYLGFSQIWVKITEIRCSSVEFLNLVLIWVWLLSATFYTEPDFKIHFRWDLLQTPRASRCFCRTAWCYWSLATDSAAARCRSATSMATTFWHAADSCRRLIATLTTATGKQRMQIPVNIPNDNGPSGTATQPLTAADNVFTRTRKVQCIDVSQPFWYVMWWHLFSQKCNSVHSIVVTIQLTLK